MVPPNNSPRRNRGHYQNDWECDFFFILARDKCVCLICRSTVTVPKKANVERHFKTMHLKYATDFPLGSEIRRAKVQELKANLRLQQSLNTEPGNNAKSIEMAAFRVTEVLIKQNKAFEDGEFIKEALYKVGEELFMDFENKSEIMSSINNIPLSRTDIMLRTEAISKNLENLLNEDLKVCKFLSLQFDESTFVDEIPHLCIFVKMVFQDMSTKEELLTIIPMRGQTKGQDIYNLFKTFVATTEFPIYKLVSISTSGASSMIRNRNGFIDLCNNDEEIPSFTTYHSIIHQHLMCAKILMSSEIMPLALKIVCSIRLKTLLRQQFWELLEEAESEFGDIVFHADVRWLNRASFLKVFRAMVPQMRNFVEVRGEHPLELQNESWLMKLAFLCDVTEKLNDLNLNLQEKNKSLTDMMNTIKTFIEMMKRYASQLRNHELENFASMGDEAMVNQNRDFEDFARSLEDLSADFEARFTELIWLEDVLNFLTSPFNENLQINVVSEKIGNLIDSASAAVEQEIIKLRGNTFLKSRAATETDFWKSISEEKLPNLYKLNLYLKSYFGSTYLCETAFSAMSAIRKKHRLHLREDHLNSYLRIGLSSYHPQYDKLVEDMQSESSPPSESE